MYANKNAAVNDYIEHCIKRSWTFERLTAQERQQVLLLLSKIRSQAKTVHGAFKAVSGVYSDYLDTVGYKPIGWREPAGEGAPSF